MCRGSSVFRQIQEETFLKDKTGLCSNTVHSNRNLDFLPLWDSCSSLLHKGCRKTIPSCHCQRLRWGNSTGREHTHHAPFSCPEKGARALAHKLPDLFSSDLAESSLWLGGFTPPTGRGHMLPCDDQYTSKPYASSRANRVPTWSYPSGKDIKETLWCQMWNLSWSQVQQLRCILTTKKTLLLLHHVS